MHASKEENNVYFSPVEFNELCRSCLSKNGLINIFENNHNQIQFSNMFSQLSLLQFTVIDNLPKKICSHCADLVTQFYDFKEKIQKSQIILQKSLKEIQRKDKSEDEYPNDFGNEDIQLENDLIQNQDDAKPKINYLTCSFCSNTFDTYKAYVIHRKKEADLRKNKQCCSICKKYITRYKLKDHMNSHTKETPHQCQTCGEKFRFKTSLSRHKFRHKDKKPHICHICGKEFIQAPTLDDHIQTHTGTKSCICNICGKTFVTRHALGNHMNMHKVKDNQIDLNNFKDRKETLTSEQKKEFLCNNCGKMFSTKALLESHLKLHSDIKPYTCKVCKKSFSQKNSLLKHSNIHSKEKSIICIICDKKFSQTGHLTYHLRQHSGERPYSCNYCEKTFNHTGSLKVHTRIHTGERPYTCDICFKGFIDSSSMKKHQKVHEENK